MREDERPSAQRWWTHRRESYEVRYLEYCDEHDLDPDDLGSVLEYESLFNDDDIPTPYDYNP